MNKAELSMSEITSTTDRTQEVIELYEKCSIEWIYGFNEYYFYFDDNNTFVLSLDWDSLYICLDGKCCEECIDQNHPEIIKIRKRLQFLNKL